MNSDIQSVANLFPLETFDVFGIYAAKVIKKLATTAKDYQLTTKPRFLTLTVKKTKKQKGSDSTRIYLVKEQLNDKGRYYKLKRLEQINLRKLDTSSKKLLLSDYGGTKNNDDRKEYMQCTFHFQQQKPIDVLIPMKTRNDLLVFLAKLSKVYEDQFGNSPQMIGVDRAELNVALEKADSGLDPSAEQLEQFVTEEEEELLTRVLQEYNLDISDPGTVTKELADRLQEMETHNINEILEREKEWEALIIQIRSTKVVLETMLSSLGSYQTELQGLKSEISQIEQKNNEMDVQSTNHEKLRVELQQLAKQFGISEKDEKIISTYSFDNESQLDEIKKLVHRIETALDNTLGYGMDDMLAIVDRRSYLAKLRKNLVDRFIVFLLKQFSLKGTQLMKEIQKKSQKDLLDQRESIYELKRYESLMPSVKSADLSGKKYYQGYLQLLSAYSQAMSDPYSNQLKAYFKSTRSLIKRDEESKASHMFFLGSTKSNAVTGSNSSTTSVLSTPMTPISTHQDSDDDDDSSFGDTMTSAMDIKNWENMRVDKAFSYWITSLCELVYAEEKFCCTFFLLNPDRSEVFENKELRKMLDKMFKVLINPKGYIGKLLRWIEKNTDLFYVLPMLNETERKISQFESSSLLPEILSSILTELNQTIFTKFKDKQCLSITTFKSPAKKISVVPYFAQFPRFMERIERILRENNDVKKRHHAENAYQIILTTMFTSMEKIGKSDPKHYQQFTLKNYAYFSRIVRKSNTDPTDPSHFISPCVNGYVQKSTERFEESLQEYIIQTIKYRFAAFFDFFEGIEECRKTIDISDVKFQTAFTSTKLNDLIKRFNSTYKKDIEDCLKRMDKHIGPKSDRSSIFQVKITEYNLFGETWTKLREYFVKRYEDFTILTRKCYTNLKFELNPIVVIHRTFSDIEKEYAPLLQLHSVSM